MDQEKRLQEAMAKRKVPLLLVYINLIFKKEYKSSKQRHRRRSHSCMLTSEEVQHRVNIATINDDVMTTVTINRWMR